jgi:hypothetical protein
MPWDFVEETLSINVLVMDFDIVKSSMKNRSVTYRKTMKTLPLEAELYTHLTQGV